jgi:hypothetical protein
MSRTQPSPTDLELIRLASVRQVVVSHAQLERWRTAGLIPRNKRVGRGRGRGSQSLLDPRVVDLVVAAGKHTAQGMPVNELALRIFTAELDVELPESVVKGALAWFAENRMGGILQHVHRAIGDAASNEDREDRAAEAAQAYLQTLNPKLRSLLRKHPQWKASVDLSMLGVLGGSAIGADATAEAMNVSLGGNEETYELLRAHLRKLESSGEFQRSSGFMPSPEAYVAIIQQQDYPSVMQVRDAVACSLYGIFYYQVCSLKAPYHPRLQAAEILLSRSSLFRSLATMPITGIPRWDTTCKYVCFLLATPKFVKEWQFLGMVLMHFLQGHIKEILRSGPKQ